MAFADAQPVDGLLIPTVDQPRIKHANATSVSLSWRDGTPLCKSERPVEAVEVCFCVRHEGVRRVCLCQTAESARARSHRLPGVQVMVMLVRVAMVTNHLQLLGEKANRQNVSF